jgi:hypothetical protein
VTLGIDLNLPPHRLGTQGCARVDGGRRARGRQLRLRAVELRVEDRIVDGGEPRRLREAARLQARPQRGGGDETAPCAEPRAPSR